VKIAIQYNRDVYLGNPISEKIFQYFSIKTKFEYNYGIEIGFMYAKTTPGVL
jgi:hypothetical protein